MQKRGAKRAWELGPQFSCDNIEQPAEYDLNNIFPEFSRETQPDREHWAVLYKLEKHTTDWKKDILKRMILWYEVNEFRPVIEMLMNWPELWDELGKSSEGGWIRAVDATNLMVEVRMEKGEIVRRNPRV